MERTWLSSILSTSLHIITSCKLNIVNILGLLGLKTLRIIEQCIRIILKRNHNNTDPQIQDVWKYYNENLHPDKLNLNDRNVWENAFHNGNWIAIFQFTEKNAQNFCKIVKDLWFY